MTFILYLCGLLLFLITAIGLSIPQPIPGEFGIGYGGALDRFIIVLGLETLVYFVAVAILLYRTPHPRLALFVLVVGGALRLLVLCHQPFLSNDVYHYIWEGWTQTAGLNPYRYVPDDSHLAFLRDHVVFPNLSRASYAHAIYGPSAELTFFGVILLIKILTLPPVVGMRVAMVLIECTGVYFILRVLDQAELPRARVLIYFWNPLPIWEFASSGHVDAIVVCLVAMAMVAASSRRFGLTAGILAAAVSTKFLPLILLPAFWRRWDWKFAIIFIAAIALLYLPYLDVGKQVFGSLSRYAAEEGLDNGRGIFLYEVIRQTFKNSDLTVGIYLFLVMLAIIFVSAIMAFVKPLPKYGSALTESLAKRSMLLGFLLYSGLSPHYPWYYAWLLVPCCVAPTAAPFYLASSAFLLYLNPTHTKLLWPSAVFIPALILASRDIALASKRSKLQSEDSTDAQDEQFVPAADT